jgi:hypothetical protein
LLINFIFSDNSESSLSRYDNLPGTLATKSAIGRKSANIGAANSAGCTNGANIGATSGISSDSGKR